MRRASGWLAAPVCLLMLVPGLRANPIRWDYTTTFHTEGTTNAGLVGPLSDTHGYIYGADASGAYASVWVHLAAASGAQAGSHLVLAGGLTASYGLLPGQPHYGDALGLVFGDHELTLSLHDVASNTWGSLTFRGRIDGSVGPGGAQVTNTFKDPQSQTLTLGANRYTVTMGPFLAPGTPPYDPWTGAIDAAVQVGPAGGLSQSPEPATLALAGMGLAGLGLAAVRRFRGHRR
jgi:hypothetical protein